jgi:hypothetical protein
VRLPNSLKTQTNKSVYIDRELLQAVQDFNRAIADPLKSFPGDLGPKVLAIGLGPIVLDSGARSLWRQGALAAEKKKQSTGTPTADYLESEHLFGLAADTTATGKPWDVSNKEKRTPERLKAWEVVREAYAQYGLDIPVGLKDPNHVALMKYSRKTGGFAKANGKRLAIMKAMERRAIEVSLSQDTTISGLSAANAQLVKEKERLITEVGNKREAIEQKTTMLQQLLQELSQAETEKARREEEARARAREQEAARHREHSSERPRREPRPPLERPDRQPRDPAPRASPARRPPVKRLPASVLVGTLDLGGRGGPWDRTCADPYPLLASVHSTPAPCFPISRMITSSITCKLTMVCFTGTNRTHAPAPASNRS